MHVHYAIVFVRDMARSVAFYRDVVGMPVLFESSHWTELGGEAGATLALHLTHEGSTEAGGTGGEEPAGRCRPGLRVDDLDAFHRRMGEHGVRCVQQPREEFGVRLAQYVDPDGLVLSVSQGRAK